MSDRITVVKCPALDDSSIRLFRDGETGTWRLWLDGTDSDPCVDLTRVQLTELSQQLNRALKDVYLNPTVLMRNPVSKRG